MEDSILGEEDIEEAFNHIRLNHSGGTSGIQAEHLRQWLWDATWEKYPDVENWEKVVALMQAAVCVGSLAKACAW